MTSHKFRQTVVAGSVALTLSLTSVTSLGSSHMDAPLITKDDAANTTDVYAFVSDYKGEQYLTTAVAVYPFEEPGIGPNRHIFDDNVRYTIHVSLGDDLPEGQATLSYDFEFKTKTRNLDTVLQLYTNVIQDVGDAGQNLVQTYRVSQRDHRSGSVRNLGYAVVPPNNQGRVTPFYNQFNDGDEPAKEGVDLLNDLDRYTQAGVEEIKRGHVVFAGQRDDGFYADIQSIFDLDLTFSGNNKPFDSQGGFNVHTIVLNIPLSELGGAEQVVGVYASTARRAVLIQGPKGEITFGKFRQVARQGNPLFNEALVAIRDKDRYSRTSPTVDKTLFAKYALAPELNQILVPLLGLPEKLLTNRTDIKGIYIPDVIRVDLSTGPARLAGNPDDADFSRLGVFGGDFLVSQVQAGLPLQGLPAGAISGGWPNGRRFGDDVVDVAVTALISDLRGPGLEINGPGSDRVDENDITYNKVFPYAATPLNGRNHGHH